MENYLDNTYIQYYPANIKITKPLGIITLRTMLNSIKNPKKHIRDKIDNIQLASEKGDKKLKDELKSQLYYFTPCVLTNGLNRNYESIIKHNPIVILDFDNLDYELAKELKQFLFDEYKCIIASFLSSSKKGVKCIARIPIVKSVEEYKEYFYGMSVKLQWIIGWDASSQNCMLPNYLTYDEDILIREDAEIFTARGYKENEFITSTVRETIDINVSEDDRKHIKNILRKSLSKITDSGHFILRGTACSAFGYAGAGYYTEDEMEDLLFEMIDEHPYLSVKANTYKRTVRDMRKFSANPIYLDKHETNSIYNSK